MPLISRTGMSLFRPLGKLAESGGERASDLREPLRRHITDVVIGKLREELTHQPILHPFQMRDGYVSFEGGRHYRAHINGVNLANGDPNRAFFDLTEQADPVLQVANFGGVHSPEWFIGYASHVHLLPIRRLSLEQFSRLDPRLLKPVQLGTLPPEFFNGIEDPEAFIRWLTPEVDPDPHLNWIINSKKVSALRVPGSEEWLKATLPYVSGDDSFYRFSKLSSQALEEVADPQAVLGRLSLRDVEGLRNLPLNDKRWRDAVLARLSGNELLSRLNALNDSTRPDASWQIFNDMADPKAMLDRLSLEQIRRLNLPLEVKGWRDAIFAKTSGEDLLERLRELYFRFHDDPEKLKNSGETPTSVFENIQSPEALLRRLSFEHMQRLELPENAPRWADAIVTHLWAKPLERDLEQRILMVDGKPFILKGIARLQALPNARDVVGKLKRGEKIEAEAVFNLFEAQDMGRLPDGRRAYRIGDDVQVIAKKIELGPQPGTKAKTLVEPVQVDENRWVIGSVDESNGRGRQWNRQAQKWELTGTQWDSEKGFHNPEPPPSPEPPPKPQEPPDPPTPSLYLVA